MPMFDAGYENEISNINVVNTFAALASFSPRDTCFPDYPCKGAFVGARRSGNADPFRITANWSLEV